MNHTLERLASAPENATRITVLTGAGVPAASGVPTFRGADGLWKTYRAHEVLARWTMNNPHCQLVTQNVDDLHVRAGSERLIRLHGSSPGRRRSP